MQQPCRWNFSPRTSPLYPFIPATHQSDITRGGCWNLFATSYQTFTRHQTRLDFEFCFQTETNQVFCKQRQLWAGKLNWAGPDRRGPAQAFGLYLSNPPKCISQIMILCKLYLSETGQARALQRQPLATESWSGQIVKEGDGAGGEGGCNRQNPAACFLRTCQPFMHPNLQWNEQKL